MNKNFYERRVYESVDDKSLSYALSKQKKTTKKEFIQQRVKQYEFLFNLFNPLLHIGHYSVRMANISILK